MKRRLTIAAVFLLAGMIVNVAVAWGCVIRPASIDAGLRGWRDYSVQLDPDDREWIEWWADRAPPGYASAPNVRMFVAEELGFSSLVAVANRFDDVEQLMQKVTRLRSGLPMRSMEGASWTAVWVGPPYQVDTYDAAVKLPWDEARLLSRIGGDPRDLERRLLLRPLWPGFAVNTILYATLLWLVFRGPWAIPRWLRVRRGLCPKCAYPIGESSLCTECGTAIAVRRAGRSCSSTVPGRGR